jgi:hypothetical protein
MLGRNLTEPRFGDHPMKRALFPLLFTLCAFCGLSCFAYAESTQAQTGSGGIETVDLPSHPVIEINASGDTIVAGAAQNNLRISLEGDPGADRDDRYRIEKTPLGIKIKVYKTKSHTTTVINAVKLTVPEDAQLIVSIDGCRVTTRGLKGLVTAKVKKGIADIISHKGPVRVELNESDLLMREFAGTGSDVGVTGKKGRIFIDFPNDAPVAPGRAVLALKQGEVQLKTGRKTQIAVQAGVREGIVKTNFPLSRPDPKNVFFTANNGQNLWEISVEKGAVTLEMPEP